MLAIILVAAALVILIVAGVILAGNSKRDRVESGQSAKIEFETKYDEIQYLYENGKMSDDEYRKQMKQIIN